MTWFYENQGVRRFDASNRVFLVLVDTDDFFGSWRLKRAQPLISKVVQRELGGSGSSGIRIPFDYEGDSYEALAQCIFVVTGADGGDS
jgi:hypothetical protein